MVADRRSANADSLLPGIRGRRFWVVISSNPGNGVVYLVVIFTRLKARHGGPSVRHFYVTRILCPSPFSPRRPASALSPRSLLADARSMI